ncbi:MAG: hypothetical protein Q8M23_06085 [Bacteroidales bacterium]|nr:hypothetical protein [Bacteroidales bacterium]
MKENSRTIKVEDFDLLNSELSSFINECRNLFFGDLIECLERPLILQPLPKVNRDFRNAGLKVSWEILNIKNSLKELYIFVNNPKTQCVNEPLLNFGYKQILFPFYYSNKIDNDVIDSIPGFLANMDLAKLEKIVILGDVFTLQGFSNFIDFFKYNKIQLHFFYRDFDFKYFSKIEALKIKMLTLVFWVNNDVDHEVINYLVNHCTNFKINVQFKTIVTSEQDVSIVNENLGEYLKHYELVPFYDTTNGTFFEENVYNTKSDLLEQKLSERELFSRMFINQLNYGRLYILPNGDIYSNLNLISIGNIGNNDLIEVLKKLTLNDEEAWLKTRNMVAPCKDCIYHFVCGPITSYEYFMDKMNLCAYNPYMNRWQGVT